LGSTKKLERSRDKISWVPRKEKGWQAEASVTREKKFQIDPFLSIKSEGGQYRGGLGGKSLTEISGFFWEKTLRKILQNWGKRAVEPR